MNDDRSHEIKELREELQRTREQLHARDEQLRRSESERQLVEERLRLFMKNTPDLTWSERREAELSVRQWANAFEFCGQGMALGDPVTNRVVTCNHAFAAMLKRPQSEIAGMPIEALYPRDERARLKRWIAEADAMGRAHYESFLVRSDGTTFPVEMNVVCRLDADGNPLYRVATAQDITERRRAEEELREAHGALQGHKLRLEGTVAERTAELEEKERYLRSILDSVPGMVGYWDTNLRNRFASHAYHEWFGVTPQQMMGIHIRELLGEHLWRLNLPYIEAALRGEPQSFERELRTPSGDVRHLQAHYVPDISDGKVRGFLVLVFDVTNIKRAKRAAEAASRAKSEFLANMSHEIRTPLNAILGLAQVGAREAKNDRAQQTFSGILEAGYTLLSHIDHVLDFSKIEAGKMTIEARRCSPADVIRRSVALVEARAKEKGLALHVDIGAAVPKACFGDGARLSQVLVNMLSNAVKFTCLGEVRVSCERDPSRPNDRIVYRVSDTGIGMTQEQIARVFSPFEQADRSTTRLFGGTGLGLTISKRIVELMGGELTVTSELGRGSLFEVSLPLAEASAEDLEAASAPAEQAESEQGGRLKGVRILAAEDNDVNRIVLEQLLDFEGADLDRVTSGAEAVERLAALGDRAFDIVLTDIQMPEMDGYEVCRRIHAIAPSLPVIGLTAHALVEVRERCFAAGMVDHVTKPVDLDTLVAVILRCARAPLGPPSAPGEAEPAPRSGAAPSEAANEPQAHFDFARLIERSNHRLPFVYKLLGVTLTDTARHAERLERASAGSDYEELEAAAHALRGISGVICADALLESAKRAEVSARERAPEARERGEELSAELAVVRGEILAKLNDRPSDERN